MNFNDYLQEQFGSYADEISNENIQKLKGEYDKLLIWQNTANIALKKGLENKGDLDYTNDYEKAMNNVQNTSSKLISEVNRIKKELGIEEDITSQHRM